MWAMARRDRKVPLVARPTPITRTRDRQLVLVTSFEPSPATFAALTLGPGGDLALDCGAGDDPGLWTVAGFLRAALQDPSARWSYASS